jgi:hypothetical protein
MISFLCAFVVRVFLRLCEKRKFRDPEHPNTFNPSSSTPGRKSGAVLLELLVGVIGKNARGQGRRAAQRIMDAGGPLPGDRTGGSLPVVVASRIGSLDFEGRESKRSLRLRLCPRHSLVLWLAPTVSTCE